MNNKKQTKIKYLDLWGLREEKYKFLESHNVKNTKWQDLELKEPHYWFVPKNTTGEEKYQKFISLKNIFEKYNVGIATGKDDVLVDFDKQSLIRRLSILDKNLLETTIENYGVKKELINEWHKELKGKNIETQIKKYNYRPFDNRFTIYNSKILQRARENIMNNFLSSNLAITTTKKSEQERFDEVLISDFLTDKHLIGYQTFVFPLYLYSEKKSVFRGQKHLDITGVQKQLDESGGRKSNIKDEFVQKLSSAYKKQISIESIFYYIYGILYSNVYRKKYNEFLKIDFPKIPFTKNYDLFCEIFEIGKEIANLHLLKSSKLDKVVAKFPVSTGNILTDGRVKKREYIAKEKRVYINDEQYFEGVELEVWDYYIGGYQVLDKWLKDRISEKLSPENINHYLKIITAIKYTIDFQKQLDKIYPKVEKSLWIN